MTKILIGKALCERLDLKEALKKGGHTVYVCEDEPFSVLSRFTECRPGIIIIDADLACRKGLLRHINKVFGHTYTVTVARADMISDIDIPDECIDRILTESCSREDVIRAINEDLASGRVMSVRTSNETESVYEVLKNLCVTPNYTGYRYLIDTVDLILAEDTDNVSLTKYIYPVIGKKYSVSENSVERSIRTVIKNTWEHAPDCEIIKYFGMYALTPGFKPSNSRYVFALADYLKNHSRREEALVSQA